MKTYSMVLISLFVSQLAMARVGVDHSGGGADMPMVTLVCGPQKDLQIQFREFESGGQKLAGPVAWIQSTGQALQTVKILLSHNGNGQRIISYGDFFCTRTINEKSDILWELQSSCEGQNFASICNRIE